MWIGFGALAGGLVGRLVGKMRDGMIWGLLLGPIFGPIAIMLSGTSRRPSLREQVERERDF